MKSIPESFWYMSVFAILAWFAVARDNYAAAIIPFVYSIRYAVERGIIAARESSDPK